MDLWIANFILMMHGLLVVSVVSGMVAAVIGILRRYRRVEAFVYFLLGCVLVSQFLYGECVMTRWEKYFRGRYDPATAYHNSCLGHYLPWIPIWFVNIAGPTLFILGLLALPFWRLYDRRKGRRAAPVDR